MQFKIRLYLIDCLPKRFTDQSDYDTNMEGKHKMSMNHKTSCIACKKQNQSHFILSRFALLIAQRTTLTEAKKGKRQRVTDNNPPPLDTSSVNNLNLNWCLWDCVNVVVYSPRNKDIQLLLGNPITNDTDVGWSIASLAKSLCWWYPLIKKCHSLSRHCHLWCPLWLIESRVRRLVWTTHAWDAVTDKGQTELLPPWKRRLPGGRVSIWLEVNGRHLLNKGFSHFGTTL